MIPNKIVFWVQVRAICETLEVKRMSFVQFLLEGHMLINCQFSSQIHTGEETGYLRLSYCLKFILELRPPDAK